MNRILLIGPLLTRSGYGEHARMIFDALRERERTVEDIELYTIATSWGNNSWISPDDPMRTIIDQKCIMTSQKVQADGGKYDFDISIQVSIPPEFKRIAPINIGVTAGIETNKVSPAWNNNIAQMSKVIVPSQHAKNGFDKSLHRIIEVIPYFYKDFGDTPRCDLEISEMIETNFNFLCVAQKGPRKNLQLTILGFLEEFQNDEDAGLLLKINSGNESGVDFYNTKEYLEFLKEGFVNEKGAYKCKLYLLHGDLSDHQMNDLYSDSRNNIKAVVSTTHGEGFGLPLFEASCNDIPVVAPGWSAHTEFLQLDGENMYAKISIMMNRVTPDAVWPGVIDQDMMWCFPDKNSYKEKLRSVKDNYNSFVKKAKKLGKHNREFYNHDKIRKMIVDSVIG